MRPYTTFYHKSQRLSILFMPWIKDVRLNFRVTLRIWKAAMEVCQRCKCLHKANTLVYLISVPVRLLNILVWKTHFPHLVWKTSGLYVLPVRLFCPVLLLCTPEYILTWANKMKKVVVKMKAVSESNWVWKENVNKCKCKQTAVILTDLRPSR